MKKLPSDIEGFAPIAAGKPTILILGTMPGAASLQRQQYYGHARNAFWPIVTALFGQQAIYDYDQLLELLISNGIALWDVLRSCRRQGSLDANIAPETIKVNDFPDFFARHSYISRIFFNGAAAEALFKKHVLKELPLRRFAYYRLPSTSPANASFSFAEKLAAWRLISQMASEQNEIEGKL